MSLPTVTDVRERIEGTPREDMRMLLKALYLLGAARISELTGEVCPKDDVGSRKQIVYGPKGTDVDLGEYQVSELSLTTAVQVLNHSMELADAFPKMKVALFRIKIAKKHLDIGEEPKSRVVALPLDKQYEPWTEELYSYFLKCGEDYVFPFSRQDAWYYITHLQPVFQGLTYPIEKYTVKQNGEVIKVALSHSRVFKLHALRHLRSKELFDFFHFDGLDFCAYVGWSIRAARALDPNISQQLGRYAAVHENWQRYFPKLLKRRTM